MRNYDIDFLKKFSLVILFLMALTGVLIGLAAWLHGAIPAEVPDAVVQQRIDRIAPAGEVYAGSTGAAAQAAAVAAAEAAARAQVAYGGTLDGGTIYQNLCAGCHTSGAGGAPTLARAQWSARLAQGEDTLHRHAIDGFTGAAGIMPPRGGNPALTDEQVAASVDWMIENLQ